MKTIGLIGGTGWVSTAEYYKLINEETNRRLGGLEYSKSILYSFNYAEIDKLNQTGKSEEIYQLVENAAQKLSEIGAEGIGLCANTMHMFADRLEKVLKIPIVHIGTATALEIVKYGFKQVGLLGTKLTMEQDFYSAKLRQYGIETIIPHTAEREYINQVIFSELFQLQFHETTRKRFVQIIDNLKNRGAKAIVLGCTEIPLLIQQKHTEVPVINTLEVHSKALVDFTLDKNNRI